MSGSPMAKVTTSISRRPLLVYLPADLHKKVRLQFVYALSELHGCSFLRFGYLNYMGHSPSKTCTMGPSMYTGPRPCQVTINSPPGISKLT